MRYLSLFSGIGSFELAIEHALPTAECVGFSEILPHAIQVYQAHFPSHHPLGDITRIKRAHIARLGRIDLIVAGFPCTNLSSMAKMKGNTDGLDGPKSGLFYDMVRVFKYVQAYNPSVRFIIENNNSMTKDNRKLITSILEREVDPSVRCVMINNASFGVQSRSRLLWSNFPIEEVPLGIAPVQTWGDVLEPVEAVTNLIRTEKMVQCLNKLVMTKSCTDSKYSLTKIAVADTKGRYKFEWIESNSKSRWDIQSRSDTMRKKLYEYPVGKSRPITTGGGGGNNCVIDRRGCGKDRFVFRRFSPLEIERLMGMPDGYTNCGLSDTRRVFVLGNSIPLFISEYAIREFMRCT
jgi:DNA-cytosine methyltransferase